MSKTILSVVFPTASIVAATLSAFAIGGTAQAAPYAVKISDLNLESASGQQVLQQRIDGVARDFCKARAPVGTRIAFDDGCVAAVRAEAIDKAKVAAQTNLASARRTTLASR